VRREDVVYPNSPNPHFSFSRSAVPGKQERTIIFLDIKLFSDSLKATFSRKISLLLTGTD
jgi:hypothetical protein